LARPDLQSGRRRRRREKRERVLERESGGEGVSSSECFLSERK